jgi:hypothetical protein
MRRKLMHVLLICSGLFVAVPTGAEPQQHAPSIEMCRADVAVWYDHESATAYLNAETNRVQTGQPNPTQIAKLSFTEVNERVMELVDCLKVDEARFNTYDAAQNFFYGVASDRFRSFVYRHNLLEQLKREDSQGLR